MRTILRPLDHVAAYGIWFFNDSNKKHTVAKPLTLEFTEISEHYMLPEPTLTISMQHAQPLLQSLVNALIKEGIRPDNDRTAGELEATKKHLQDLQTQLQQAMRIIENNIGNK